MGKGTKYFLLLLLFVVPVWIIHGQLIMKISKVEREISKEKVELRELEKVVNEKRFEYDQKIDLEKIEKDMRINHKMEISKDINFFKINGILD